MSQEKLINRLEQELSTLPFFVKEYIQKKRIVPYSITTLYEYSKEFRRFFEWLAKESRIESSPAQISLSELRQLSYEDVELYKGFLLSSPRLGTTSDGQLRSYVSIQRSITALKSLFHFLSLQTSDEHGQPYIAINIMEKVDNVKTGRTLQDRSRSIENKLFIGDESLEFISFIDETYENLLSSHQAKHAFRRNKIRDIAIISLFLGTGIRLSELVNMKVSDLDVLNMEATVIRKGGFKDTTMISSVFMPYIVSYLEQRSQLYQPSETEKSLFLSYYRGTSQQIDQSTVEKLVGKYSEAFKVRVTPHKLRHTVGTQLYKKTNSLLTVSHQLGQTGTSATAIYTHIVDEEKREAINDLWTT
ncbi:tyrosine recombinase XerS [Vagococcus sp. JNUCC 83]